jgi:tetratricopeptide (TPR) repeat protein
VAKLKSLGYLAYSSPVHPGSSENLPDPKDRLKVYRLLLRAYTLAAAGRSEESNQALLAVEAEEPKLHLVSFLRAENLVRLGRQKEAEQNYLASLKIFPNFDQAIMGLAHLYMEEGQEGQAKPWLELAVHLNPHDFLAYYGLGLAARWEKDNEAAYSYFLKAVQEKPDFGISQQELGITLVDLKRFSEALGPLSQAEKLGMDTARLHNYYGGALASTGRLKEAVDHYQRAIKLEPDDPQFRLNLALAHLKMGEKQIAQHEFEGVCQASPSLCQPYRKIFE